MIDRSTNIQSALRSRQRGVLLNPFRFGPSVPTDPYFSNVVSLLHFDSAFPDVKGKTWTVTDIATTSTSVKKFGVASGYFNGGYIASAPSSDWAFGTGDFTVELWLYPGAMPTGYYFSPIGNRSSGTGWCFFFRPSGNLQFSNGGASAISSSTISTSTWYHAAYSRQGSAGRLFINGVKVAEVVDTVDSSSTNSVCIGRNGTPTDVWLGYIDDSRVTKGIARYTADFTPPAAAFPNS